MRKSTLLYGLFLTGLSAGSAYAGELTVGPDGQYANIGAAIAQAQEGDVILIAPGRYEETIETQTPGVTLRATMPGQVVVTQSGYVLRVRHAGTTVEGLILDGQFSDRDGVQVRGEAHGLTLRNVEVRNVGADCVDMGAQHDVTIDGCQIHHCLRSNTPNCAEPDCREDAHGITGAAMRNLIVRDTEIHSFSGDAIQLDPGRSAPGWTDLTIHRCTFWLAPLTEAVGGYAAGVVPGENALDTKTSNDVVEPARVFIGETIARGFRGGLIGNMAAFNLKENVLVHLDRVTVHDSEIAFRLRGRTGSRPRGAQVSMSNTLVYDVDTAIRYEDGIETISMDNVTLGADIGRLFQDVSEGGRIVPRNVLVLGDALPAELQGESNLAVGPDCFADLAQGHHLATACTAIDTGMALDGSPHDLEGISRPQGDGWDIGAYEYCVEACNEPDPPMPEPDAGVPTEDGGLGADMGLPMDATLEDEHDSTTPPTMADPDPDGSAPSGQFSDIGTDAMTPGGSDGDRSDGGCSGLGQSKSPVAPLPWLALFMGALWMRRSRS